MKLIIAGAGEGKTQRIIEIASGATEGKITSTIYTFEDTTNFFTNRIEDHMKKMRINKKNIDLIKVVFLRSMEEEKFLNMLKETDSDIIFIDGIKQSCINDVKYKSITDLLDKVKVIENGLDHKGIIATVQRHRTPNKQGVNVIEYNLV